MRTRTAVVSSLVLVAAVGSLSPAMAKPKPITKSYTATTTSPDPTPFAPAPVGDGTCSPKLAGAKHETPFTIPYAGSLVVDLTGFQGDWALGVFDSDGSPLATSDQGDNPTDLPNRPEHVDLGFKKKGQVVTIRACNFSGGLTANVKYVYRAK